MKRQLPTLRAVGPDDEPEGFTIAQVDVTDLDTWHVETVGMRASDIGDTMTSESLARLIAAAPDLLAACEAATEVIDCICDGDDDGGCVRCLVKTAIKKARGEK